MTSVYLHHVDKNRLTMRMSRSRPFAAPLGRRLTRVVYQPIAADRAEDYLMTGRLA
jgi:hypothetical protein